MENTEGILAMQKGEITEHLIYSNLAKRAKDAKNRAILERIASDELRHYGVLRKITGMDLAPDIGKAGWHTLVSTIFGLAFGLKLMENGEGGAQRNYSLLQKGHPELGRIIQDEEKHEAELISMIREERLEYASSVVLGLNDALVELTGTLAGLTLALGNARLIAITGLVMGVAAALSMAASSYLSANEEGGKNAKKAAVYTGITYISTVALLISPYFLLDNVYHSLGAMLAVTMVLIASYTFYITTAKGQKFAPRFMEMALISLGVAAVSFVIGLLLKNYVGAG